MVKKLLVGLMMVMFMAGGALAINMPECWVGPEPDNGGACWEIYTQADWRYYHDSAQHSDELYNPGGYKISVAFWNMTTPPYDVVEIKSDHGNTAKFPPFPVYKFLGSDLIEYIMWFGHTQNAQGTWSVYLDGELLEDGVKIPIGVPKAPVVAVHKMKKKADGIELKFSAPLVENFQRINLRIFDALGEDFAEEIRFYDISKSINTEIPLEYSGRKARFEYRIQGGVRTLLYVTLP